MSVIGLDRDAIRGVIPALLLQLFGVSIAVAFVFVGLPSACGIAAAEIFQDPELAPVTVFISVAWILANATMTLVVITTLRWRATRGGSLPVTIVLAGASAGLAAAGFALATAIPLHGSVEVAAANLAGSAASMCGDPQQFLFMLFSALFGLAVSPLLYIAAEAVGVLRSRSAPSKR